MASFLPPLRRLLANRSIPSPSAADATPSNAFYHSIILAIQCLTQSFPPDLLTADWILQALDFLRSMHAGFLHLVDGSPPHGQQWIKEYMNVSSKLMEVCNILNRGIGGLGHFLMVIDAAVRDFETGAIASKAQQKRVMRSVADCRDVAARLDRENGLVIEEMAGTLRFGERELSDPSSLNGAMLLMRHTSASFAKILLSGLVHVRAFALKAIPSSSVLSVCLSHLEVKFHEAVSRRSSQRTECFIFLHEFEQLQNSLQILLLEMQSIQGKIGSKSNEVRIKLEFQQLKKNREKFKDSLNVVELRVNDLFYEIIEGRKKHLNNFSQSTS